MTPTHLTRLWRIKAPILALLLGLVSACMRVGSSSVPSFPHDSAGSPGRSSVKFWAVLRGTLIRDQWWRSRPADVIEGYKIAETLIDELPSAEQSRAREFLRERLETATRRMADHSDPGVVDSVAGGDSGFEQCPPAAFDAYNTLVRQALYARFVDGDLRAASNLCGEAINLLEHVPGGMKLKDVLPAMCRQAPSFQCAFTPSMSASWHEDHLKHLTTPTPTTTDSSRNANGQGLLQESELPASGSIAFVLSSGSDKGFDIALRVYLEQGLLADKWAGNPEISRVFYHLAERLAVMAHGPSAERQRAFLRSVVTDGDATDVSRNPGTGRQNTRGRMEFRSWLEPGYVTFYTATIEEALFSQYYLNDKDQAIALYEVLRALAQGFDGSTAAFQTSLIQRKILEMGGS